MMEEKTITETDRLVLRRFRRENLQDLFEYMSEIRKAFSEGVHRIYAECDPCNAASWKLLERLGFTREAHFRRNVFF